MEYKIEDIKVFSQGNLNNPSYFVGQGNGNMYVYDRNTDKLVKTIKIPLTVYIKIIVELSLYKVGVVIGPFIYIYNINEGRLINSFYIQLRGTTLAIKLDDNTIVTGGSNGDIDFWDIYRERRNRDTIHKYATIQGLIKIDNSTIAVCYYSDIEQRSIIDIDTVTSIASTVKDVNESKREVREIRKLLPKTGGHISSIAKLTDSRIVVHLQDLNIYIWDYTLPDDLSLRILAHIFTLENMIQLSEDILVGDGSHRAYIFNISTGSLIKTLEISSESSIRSIVRVDETTFAVLIGDGKILTYDVLLQDRPIKQVKIDSINSVVLISPDYSTVIKCILQYYLITYIPKVLIDELYSYI